MEAKQGLIVTESMSLERISLHLNATNADDILIELVGLIPEIKVIPGAPEKLLTALREREKLCSTGVGDGVAFPHSRNAIVGLVSKPIVVFGRHETGISYGALDRIPARLFFLVIAPTVSIHLQILARLSRMVRNPRFRQLLLKVDTAQEVLKEIEQEETSNF